VSPSKALSFSSKPATVAGKVFLLGEYAVLGGAPALVAAVGPRFAWMPGQGILALHPASPAGKLLAWAKARLPDVEITGSFSEAHGGRGGFGGSTAQFALLYAAIAPGLGLKTDWQSVWTLYRELTSDVLLPPSGADLATQWQGGVCVFRPGALTCERMSSSMIWERLLVLSAVGQAGRKVATHEHLLELTSRGFPSKHSGLIGELAELTARGLQAIQSENPTDLGQVFTCYAETLSSQGMELAATRRDREALRELPGVLGVKGAGALQADAVMVCFEGSEEERQNVIEKARELGLSWILPSEHRMGSERGLQWG